MNHDPTLVQAVIDQFPELEQRGQATKKSSGVALAARNIRILLKKHFPNTAFRVICDRYASGSSVFVYWNEIGGQEIYREVSSLLDVFQYQHFNGMEDESVYGADPWGLAFRSLFGSTTHVAPQPSPLSAEKASALTASVLDHKTAQPRRRATGSRRL